MIKSFLHRCKATIVLCTPPLHNHTYNKTSYYLNEAHKSKLRIFFDQLYFIWKYGNVEKYYYTYGFDRKTMTRERMDSYIINEDRFLSKVDYFNSNIHRNLGRFSGRCIVSDKFYFYVFLKSLDLPTPKIFLYIRNGKVLYGTKGVSKIEDFFCHDFDAFAKPYGGQLGNGAFSLRVKDGVCFVNGREENKESVIKIMSKSHYIVQERVIQHEEMNRLCST